VKSTGVARVFMFRDNSLTFENVSTCAKSITLESSRLRRVILYEVIALVITDLGELDSNRICGERKWLWAEPRATTTC